MRSAASCLVSFIFLIWFAASIAGMIYVSRHAAFQWLIPAFLGQYLLMFGILGFIAMYSSGKKGLWIDITAMLAGVIMIVFTIVFHYGSKQTKTEIIELIPVFIGGAMFTAGSCFTAAVRIGKKRSDEKYSTPVSGTCVDRKIRFGSRAARLYCPVYEIDLNGKTVTLDKNVFTNVGIPQIGESRTLYIDENDLEGYAEPIADKAARIISLVISVSFTAAGAVILLVKLI